MKEIHVKTKLFFAKQSVFIRDLETGDIETYSIPLDELITFISSINNVKRINLIGNEKYVQRIKADYLTKFSNKNIPEITINGSL